MNEMDESVRPVQRPGNSMAGITPTWRSFRRRVRCIAVEELCRLFDWSLPGWRIYGLQRGERFYIVAKVDVETPEPLYPCRPSERRDYQQTVYRLKREYVDAAAQRLLKSAAEREAWRKYQEFLGAHEEGRTKGTWDEHLDATERDIVRRANERIRRHARKRDWEPAKVKAFHEFPCRDESKWTYPTGRFTTWLRTAEIRDALARGHVMRCHEVLISLRGNEDRTRWERLRTEVFKRYGRRCMRCGSTSGEMHVDHVKPWRDFPELRYNADNLQILYHACHEWKGRTDSENTDFRPTGRKRGVRRRKR